MHNEKELENIDYCRIVNDDEDSKIVRSYSKITTNATGVTYYPQDYSSSIEEYGDIDGHIEKSLAEMKHDEKVNHPNYYNRYSVEVIEMARRIWGDEAMKSAAEITAFIYRMRAGVKPDNPVNQDLDKEEFWLNYAKKLKNND